MNEVQRKIEELKQKADAVSKDIREAEAMLRELPIKSSSFNVLRWDAEKKRIMMGDKPLIEHKLKERIDGHWFLNCLVNQVLLESEEFLDSAQID